MTAIDALYATPFPTLSGTEDFVLKLPSTCNNVSTMTALDWNAELGPNNHALLARIFDSRVDRATVREVGQLISERGGLQAMRACFYIYCHIIGARLKDMGLTEQQWSELFFSQAKIIEYFWDWVGE